MTRGEKIIEKIKGIFEEIRSKYPQITDEDLYGNGAIYYMNGNDGTDFDWNANGNCSELYMYHSNEIGFIKIYVNHNDTYTAYVFPLGEMTAEEVIRGELDEGDALYLATILYRKADREYIYDDDIDNIDFSYEPDEWELREMNEAYEDENDESEEW